MSALALDPISELIDRVCRYEAPRRASGRYTRADLARHLGATPQRLEDWRVGRRPIPLVKLMVLTKMAKLTAPQVARVVDFVTTQRTEALRLKRLAKAGVQLILDQLGEKQRQIADARKVRQKARSDAAKALKAARRREELERQSQQAQRAHAAEKDALAEYLAQAASRGVAAAQQLIEERKRRDEKLAEARTQPVRRIKLTRVE